MSIESLKKQLQSSRDENAAVQHQLNSFREAQAKLESILEHYRDKNQSTSDSSHGTLTNLITETNLQAYPSQAHEGILQLQRQLNKYRIRSRIHEEVSDVYRSAFVAALTSHNRSTENTVVIAPSGKIIEIVRKSYEDGMSALEEEVESGLGIIRQNNSYMNELRARLEDTLKTIYRHIYASL